MSQIHAMAATAIQADAAATAIQATIEIMTQRDHYAAAVALQTARQGLLEVGVADSVELMRLR